MKNSFNKIIIMILSINITKNRKIIIFSVNVSKKKFKIMIFSGNITIRSA